MSGTQKKRLLKRLKVTLYYRTVGFYFVAQCGISILLFNSRKLLVSNYIRSIYKLYNAEYCNFRKFWS